MRDATRGTVLLQSFPPTICNKYEILVTKSPIGDKITGLSSFILEMWGLCQSEWQVLTVYKASYCVIDLACLQHLHARLNGLLLVNRA